jgi:hypothetical protein
MHLLSLLFSSIFIGGITFFPIYLWAYGISHFQQVAFNRFRFFLGCFVWMLSVGLIYELQKMEHVFSGSKIVWFFLLLWVLYLIVYIATRFGSWYIRGFLRKIALLHIFLIFALLGSIYMITSFFQGTLFFLLSVNILFAALLEEASKHLVSVGTTGIQLRFSARDMIFLNFFCVLGFIFSENLLYLIYGYWQTSQFSLFQWGFRSFFTLIAHVFSASLCAFFWWKALSFSFLSRKYIVLFLFGIILATFSHTCYNLLAHYNIFYGIALYTVFAYVGFTYLLSYQRS